jgi:Flp pilus assembly protein TadG
MRRLLGSASRRLRAFVAAFARARDGVAAVEFALVMPIMLTMYLGSLELSQLINVDQRITTIAGTVGDLVARADGTVAAADLSDYFTAATAILAPFSNSALKQTVTVVAVSADGSTNNVVWSQAYNGGTIATVGKPFSGAHAIPAALLTGIFKNNWVIVSDATYPYTPLLGLFFKKPFTLYHQNFYLPRYPGVICYNTTTC